MDGKALSLPYSVEKWRYEFDQEKSLTLTWMEDALNTNGQSVKNC
jgi:hypothetical protein